MNANTVKGVRSFLVATQTALKFSGREGDKAAWEESVAVWEDDVVDGQGLDVPGVFKKRRGWMGILEGTWPEVRRRMR